MRDFTEVAALPSPAALALPIPVFAAAPWPSRRPRCPPRRIRPGAAVSVATPTPPSSPRRLTVRPPNAALCCWAAVVAATPLPFPYRYLMLRRDSRPPKLSPIVTAVCLWRRRRGLALPALRSGTAAIAPTPSPCSSRSVKRRRGRRTVAVALLPSPCPCRPLQRRRGSPHPAICYGAVTIA